MQAQKLYISCRDACWRVQVNSEAPTITDASTGVSVKPVASSQVVGDGSDGSQASSPSSIGGAANTVTASATPAGQLLSYTQPGFSRYAPALHYHKLILAFPSAIHRLQ